MKTLIILATLILSTSAIAGGTNCKAYVGDHLVGYEEKEMGITYYDYAEILEENGYEITDVKEEADLSIRMGAGYIERCYEADISNFEYWLSESLSNEAIVYISYTDLETQKEKFIEKNIYKNMNRKKVLRKIAKLATKLPRCTK